MGFSYGVQLATVTLKFWNVVKAKAIRKMLNIPQFVRNNDLNISQEVMPYSNTSNTKSNWKGYRIGWWW